MVFSAEFFVGDLSADLFVGVFSVELFVGDISADLFVGVLAFTGVALLKKSIDCKQKQIDNMLITKAYLLQTSAHMSW